MQSYDDIDPRLPEITDSLYRVAAKAAIVRDHKLLLVKEAAGWYSFPGGGVDYGEQPHEALIRELKEEIGQTVSIESVAEDPFFISMGHVIKHWPRVALCYKVAVDDSFEPSEQELSFIWADEAMLATIPLSPLFSEIKERITL